MLAEVIKRQLSAGGGTPTWARGAAPRSQLPGPAKQTPVSWAAKSYGAAALRLVSRWRDLPAMFLTIPATAQVSPPTHGHPIAPVRQCGSCTNRWQETPFTLLTRGETSGHLLDEAAAYAVSSRRGRPLRGLASVSNTTIACAPPGGAATCQRVHSPGSERAARNRHVSTDTTLSEKTEHGIAHLTSPGRCFCARSANRRLFTSASDQKTVGGGCPAAPDGRTALTGDSDPDPDLDTPSSPAFALVPPSPSISSPSHPSFPPPPETLPSGGAGHLSSPVGSLWERDCHVQKAGTAAEDASEEGDDSHTDCATPPHDHVAIEGGGTGERGEEGVWIDYLALSDQELLRQCQVDTYRASGPGGQHRNKTESAVRLRHVSGVVANASERRSQHQNKEMALQRLRQSIALNIRRTIDVSNGCYQPSPEFLAILPRAISSKAKNAPRVSYGPNHPQFWKGAQQLLDVFVAAGCSVSDTAKVLRMTSSMTAKLLTSEGTLLRRVNQLRTEKGMKNLR
ncbi:hypothetical protein CBR_g50009 [Chara braunii]|uniref:Prokaryotic-type class I peptide chain release factors domain-containing protein n=1 Tax=Chara braunii TaxID=69332 RepID=A0A388K584_CHABU|nr:hypothetical protein CBR_g50009 [Chara braunii]|eukprot:GBG65218.1 hypothetical protein CBR_g50009 [Chara braunii]